MKEYITVFKTLTDDTRLRILRILSEAGFELCVCEIVDALQLPNYTVSRHMKELKNADLIKERREGRFIFYALIENRKKFVKNLFELIRAIPDPVFDQDAERLRKRLSQRTFCNT